MARRRGNKQLGVHMGVGRVVNKGFLGGGEDKKGFGKTREEGCVEEIQQVVSEFRSYEALLSLKFC